MVNHDLSTVFNLQGGKKENGADHDKKTANIIGKKKEKSGSGKRVSKEMSPSHIDADAEERKVFPIQREQIRNSLFEQEQNAYLENFVFTNFSVLNESSASEIKWKEVYFDGKKSRSFVSQKYGYLTVPRRVSHMIDFVACHTVASSLLSRLQKGIAYPETRTLTALYYPKEIYLLKKIGAQLHDVVLHLIDVSAIPKELANLGLVHTLFQKACVYVLQFNSLGFSTSGKFSLGLSENTHGSDLASKLRKAHKNVYAINETGKELSKAGKRRLSPDCSTKKKDRRTSSCSDGISNSGNAQKSDQLSQCADTFTISGNITKLSSVILESSADDSQNGQRSGNVAQQTRDISEPTDTSCIGGDLADGVKRVSTRLRLDPESVTSHLDLTEKPKDLHTETLTAQDGLTTSDNSPELSDTGKTREYSEKIQETASTESERVRRDCNSLLREIEHQKQLFRSAGSRGEFTGDRLSQPLSNSRNAASEKADGQINSFSPEEPSTTMCGRHFETERVSLQKRQIVDDFTLDIKGAYGNDPGQRDRRTERNASSQRQRADQGTQTEEDLEEPDEILSHVHHQRSGLQDHSSDFTPPGVEDYRILSEFMDDRYSESEVDSFVSSETSGYMEATNGGYFEEFRISDKPQPEDKPTDGEGLAVSNLSDYEDDSGFSADGSEFPYSPADRRRLSADRSECLCSQAEDRGEPTDPENLTLPVAYEGSPVDKKASDQENSTAVEADEDGSAEQQSAVQFVSPVQASSPTASECFSEYSEWCFDDTSLLSSWRSLLLSQRENRFHSLPASLQQLQTLCERALVADTASASALAVSATEALPHISDEENCLELSDDDHGVRIGDNTHILCTNVTPIACTEDTPANQALENPNFPHQTSPIYQGSETEQCPTTDFSPSPLSQESGLGSIEKYPETSSPRDSKHSKSQADDRTSAAPLDCAEEIATDLYRSPIYSQSVVSQESDLSCLELDPESSSPYHSEQLREQSETPVDYTEESRTELCPTPVHSPSVVSLESGLKSHSQYIREQSDGKVSEDSVDYGQENGAELCPTPVYNPSAWSQVSEVSGFAEVPENTSSRADVTEASFSQTEVLETSVVHSEIAETGLRPTEAPEATAGRAEDSKPPVNHIKTSLAHSEVPEASHAGDPEVSAVSEQPFSHTHNPQIPDIRSEVREAPAGYGEDRKAADVHFEVPQTFAAQLDVPETSCSHSELPEPPVAYSKEPQTSACRTAAPETPVARSNVPRVPADHSDIPETSVNHTETSAAYPEVPEVPVTCSDIPETFVNPLSHTTSSAQLCGGRCVVKRVNRTEASLAHSEPPEASVVPKSPFDQTEVHEARLAQSIFPESLVAHSEIPENPDIQDDAAEAPACKSAVSETPVACSDASERPIAQSACSADQERPVAQSAYTEVPETSVVHSACSAVSERPLAYSARSEVEERPVTHAACSPFPGAPVGHTFSMANRSCWDSEARYPPPIQRPPLMIHRAGAPPPWATQTPILDISQAAEPAMSRLFTRRGTYHRVWPANSGQDPAMLSLCGFYYAEWDGLLRCWWCGVHLRLRPGEDPWEVHRQSGPGCQYLKEMTR